LAAEKTTVSGIFNLASDEIVRLDDLVARIVRICESSSSVVFKNNSQEDEVRFSSRRLRDSIGWKPVWSIKRSLQRCLEYYASSQ
ncbi:MAG: hypothetical protein NT079_06460, partial [Candidatus Omnitrophica bacterium]|nr:hypothetical protein [Candidatus Omnitrophota bacterium]